MTYTIAVRDYFTNSAETTELVDLLEFDWPGAVEAMGAMSRHLSPSILRNDTPLVRDVFTTALAHYAEAVQYKKAKLDDTTRLAVFIHHLINTTFDEAQIKIVSETGEEWTLDSHESFASWRLQQQGDLYAYRHVSQNRAETLQALYERVVPNKIQTILRRSKYESAVVGRCLDSGDRALPDTDICARAVDREGDYQGGPEN